LAECCYARGGDYALELELLSAVHAQPFTAGAREGDRDRERTAGSGI
jgi:hypothetical protein